MRASTIGKLFVLLLAMVLVCATTAPAKKPPPSPPPAAYDITDLGTLGGEWSQAFGMHGAVVVGHSLTSAGEQHAALWEVDAQGAVVDTVDLGTLPGGDTSRALGVNGLGQIVGFSRTGEVYEDPNNSGEYLPVEHAVLWRSRESAPEDLGILPSGPVITTANAISDTGVIVGNARFRAVLWWLDESGNVNGPIDLVAGGPASAVDVNDAGLVAVQVVNSPYLIVPEDSDGDGTPDLWMRDDDGDGANDLLRYLGFLDADHQHGNVGALNEAGQVTGESAVSKKRGTANPDWFLHAFRITPEDTDGDGEPDLWNQPNRRDGTNELMEDLGTIKAYENNCNYGSYGNDINDGGTVVGRSVPDCHTYAVLFDGDKVIELLDVIPDNSGWSELLSATGINDDEQIAGYGRLDDSTVRAFVLTPPAAP